ncbi:MAG: N-acetylmuramoyl-L-alanine amidase [Nocardioidaceae bacterium]
MDPRRGLIPARRRRPGELFVLHKSAMSIAVLTSVVLSAPTQLLPQNSAVAEEAAKPTVTGQAISIGSRTPAGVHSTDQLSATHFTMLGATWRGDADPRIEFRTSYQGTWSSWRELDTAHTYAPADDAPGVGSEAAQPEPAPTAATNVRWVGPSDGVQIRVFGDQVRDPEAVLVDSGVLPGDHAGADAPVAAQDPAANPTKAPQPRIRTRQAWGAEESWRSGEPTYNHTLKQAHLHHTAGTNAYSKADVPAIIRGDYWYHTQILGWSDLAYNFVVDKFGRIWEGRAGGVSRPVRGAHTLGFNHASVGIAAVGDLSTARPSEQLMGALVRLTAWKLDKYDRRPAGRTRMISQGSDLYPTGARVRLPVIDGHRDTNETACPGKLYAKLPAIRDRAQRRADTTVPMRRPSAPRPPGGPGVPPSPHAAP